MAANPQPAPQPNKLTIQEVAQLAGFMVSTIRKWQRDGKIPPAPTDGDYSPEYVEMLQTYRKNALSTQSKNRWAKLTCEERTEVAKKQWTPERKKTQSITMRNVRLGLTGLTREELEEWNTNSKNAADTQEVRKAKARGADDLWARRNADSAQADLDAAQARQRAEEAEANVAAAQAEVDRLAEKLAQAKAKLEAANAKWSDVGRTAEDEVWAKVDELYKQELKWPAIKAQVDKAMGYSRTIEAYQEGRKRYLARQKPTK